MKVKKVVKINPSHTRDLAPTTINIFPFVLSIPLIVWSILSQSQTLYYFTYKYFSICDRLQSMAKSPSSLISTFLCNVIRLALLPCGGAYFPIL